MAQVFLPCESQQWPEDKKYFTLLSKIRFAEELDKLVKENTVEHPDPAEKDNGVTTAQRIASLQGLSCFFSEIATQYERDLFFDRTLPFICRSASCLDVLVPEQGVPFLQQQESATVILGRKLILSLISNAFLCTFPNEHPLGKKSQGFNFNKFFKLLTSGDTSRVASQAAKLRCFLNYFHRLSYREEDGVPGTVSFTRQSLRKEEIPSLTEWVTCEYPLCHVAIDNEGKIEDAGSRTLQVDFAAAHIGGGVLRGGKVQEEIRFCICPELLVSMLINDSMEDNEAIIIMGYERFSYYDGYAGSFKYAGDYEDVSERDVYGNLNTSMAAINAIKYSNSNGEDQYLEENLLRDLNKALAGFVCRNEQGDMSLQAVPMRQGEYGLEDYGSTATGVDLTSLCETASQTTEDELVAEGSGFLDMYSTSLSSSIINQALKTGGETKEKNEGEDYRTIACSLVRSVVEGALRKTSDEVEKGTASSIDVFASSLADSILLNIRKTPESSEITTPNSLTSPTQDDPPHSSSRSSDITGQPILPIEYTDSIVEAAINKGINQAFTEGGSGCGVVEGQMPSIATAVPVLQVNDEETEKEKVVTDRDSKGYADSLASSILGSVLVPASPKKTIVGLSSASGGVGIASHPKKPSPLRSKGQKAKSRQPGGGAAVRSSHNRGSLNMTDGLDTPISDPRALNPPLSRMSLAWSTTSTRGEDSMPSSPTELDVLAINMVSSVTDLVNVMADMIIRDAIQACAFPQDIAEHLTITSQYDKEEESVTVNSKGMSKIDTFLQSLHNAGSRTSLDASLSVGFVFSPSLYELRKNTLRTVATGNWGCGAFKGDPQLKSLLQWMAVSASSRPEMKYYPFNEERLQQLHKVIEHFLAKNTTVGQLCQLVSQYCISRRLRKNDGDLFSFLLSN